MFYLVLNSNKNPDVAFCASILSNENRPFLYSGGGEWKPSRLFKVALWSQTKESGTIHYNSTYPLSHLLLQKRLNYGKDAFENPGLIYDVNSLDPNWKAILYIKKTKTKHKPHTYQTSNISFLCFCQYAVIGIVNIVNERVGNLKGSEYFPYPWYMYSIYVSMNHQILWFLPAGCSQLSWRGTGLDWMPGTYPLQCSLPRSQYHSPVFPLAGSASPA